MKIGIHNFPASLNPLYTTDEISQAIVNKVYDSLFYFDCSGKLQKGLTEKYFFEDNNKEIIITLKKKNFFSNGKELDSDDVLATLERLKDKSFKSPYISKLNFIKHIKKNDKYTLKIILNYPVATWKSYLTIKILNANEIKKSNPANFRHMILSGTGAYRFHQIREPSKIVLKLNNIHEKNSMYRNIEYIVVSYTQLAPLKLINNEIDICELQPGNRETYIKLKEWQEKFTVLKYKKFGYTYLVFNLKNSKLNRNIRRIFYNILIHGNFLDRFLKGKGERVITPFLLLNDKVSSKKLEALPLKNELRLKILTNSESKIRKEFVLFLKTELKSFNIDLSPLFLEYHTFLKYIKKSGFDIAVSGFLLDIDYDMKDVFHSESYFNYASFKNPEMDRLLDKGLRELNPIKRKAIYYKAHNLWLDELPLIPLFNLYYYVGISKRIKIPDTTSKIVSSEGDFLYNIRQWTMK